MANILQVHSEIWQGIWRKELMVVALVGIIDSFGQVQLDLTRNGARYIYL